MTTKPRNFNQDLCYHIYNRGVEKRNVFKDSRDYQRFMDTMSYYRQDQPIPYVSFQRLTPKGQAAFQQQTNPAGLFNRRVKISAYCLMPNHFHFILRPTDPSGITKFVGDVANSYTRYFNIKNERTGYLFQGTFKAKEINSEMSLLHLSRYIHLNPINSSKTNPAGSLKSVEDYSCSSYPEWVGLEKPHLVDEAEVRRWMSLFASPEKYREFTESGIGQEPGLNIADLILE